MKIFSAFLYVSLAFASGESALAANRYVRAGAAGNGSGSDWTNAYASLPASLVRGDTYYVAGGSYPAYTFDDAVSGTAAITVKKATAADHGTDVGWLSAYGSSQAAFGAFTFRTSNYVIDGQVRNESNWFDAAAYGISIGKDTEQQQIIIKNYGNAPDNIAIKNAYLPGWAAALPNTTQRIYAVDIDDGDGGSTSTGLVFSKMYVSGSNNVWFLRTTDGAIVEYSASSGVKSNGANHGEIVNLYYSGNNAIIRHNQFKDAYLDSGGTALVAITQANGLQFYGNVAYNFNTGDASIGFNGYSSSRNRIYNNTFINGKGYNSGMRFGSGTDNLIYNNLFIGCTTVAIEGTHDYNAFSDSSNRGEAHGQVNVPASIIVDSAGGNYALKSATAAGISVPNAFGIDALGNVRGADGVLDRGAYEFGGVVVSPSPTPTVAPTTSPSPSPTVSPSPKPTVSPSPSPTVTASPSPSPSPSPVPVSGQTLFTNQLPQSLSNSDGAGVNYELGLRFASSKAGDITAIRFYKSARESGTHVGKIYSSSGALLAQVTFTNESASGWQVQRLSKPLRIAANTQYVVSVNTGNTYYVATVNGLASQVFNGVLRSTAKNAGVYGPVGSKPSSAFQNSNYFRDVVFMSSN